MPTYTITSGDYTDQAATVFRNLLRGGQVASDYSISFIDIGMGGEIDPATGLDTGARVAPVATETEIRKRIFRARVISSELVGTQKIKFTAKVEAHECVSAVIDEWALVCGNNVMVAHYVTPATIAPPQTDKYTKSGYIFLFLDWTIDLEVVI